MSPLSNATTLANYASGIGTQGATLEVQTANKRVGIGTTNPQGPEGSLQVGTAVTISGNSGIVSATTFHGDFGSSTSVAGNLTVSGVITYEDVTNIDSIGIMTARSDLSIADKIIHTGDTNTAIRFPAADTVTAETSGSERVRITSDGKIGINQSTPQTTFHSTGTTNGQQATFGIDDSGLKISTFQKTDNDAGVILDAQKSSNGTLTFATTGTERMRIDSSGRMGLGTNSPSALLHVSAAYNVIGLKVFGGSAGYSSPLIVGNAGGTEYLRVDDGGRLLVNTTTSRIVEDHVGNGPQAKIQIEGTNSDAIMSIISAGTADANRCGTISLGRHRNSTIGGTPTIVQNGDALGAIVFAAGDGTDMRTSGAKIHAIVDGTPGSNDMPGALIFSTTTDGSSNPYNQERMRITSAGDIGLGVTPVAGSRLHVKGAADCYVSLQAGSSSGNDAILFRRSTGEQKGAILYDTDDNYFLINVNDGERLRIDSSGRLLVGATSAATAGSLAQYAKFVLRGDTGSASSAGIINLARGTGAASMSSGFSAGVISFSDNAGLEFGDIGFNADGAPSGSSTPGRFVIKTTASGSTTPTERMRIDSAGSLLVATTNTSSFPDRLISVGDHTRQSSYLDIRSSLVGALLFADGTSGNAAYRGQVEYNHSDDSMRFWTGAQERMRLTNNGNLTINGTSVLASGILSFPFYGQTQNGLVIKSTWNGSNASYVVIKNSSDSTIGSITASQTATSFNTSSDHRLKENVVDISDGITRVKQLQPKRFNFIVDADTTVDGFIAHEAQTVVPEAVTGTHNEVDENGDPVMQSIDKSKLVPLLTAALKEAIAEIESLKARVTVLEG